MITSQYFNITSDASIFASNRHISNKQHCAVWVKSLTNVWSQIPYNDYDLVNNSIILDTALLSTIYSQVELRVADSQEELGTPVTDISTTASIRDEVIVVADNIDSITTVSENITNLNNIADNIVKAGVVADNIADVTNVADNIVSVSSLASIRTQLESLYADKTKLTSIYNDKITLDSIYSDKSKLDAIFSDLNAIEGLFSIKAKLESIYADKSKLDSLYADKTQLDTIYTNISNILTVYTNISSVIAVSNNIASVNTTASNIVDVNTFSSKYKISSIQPSSPTAGDLWFDTTANFMKVYDGNGFIVAGSSVNGTSSRNTYTATSGQTSFASTYDLGYVDVYLNGVKLQPIVDFTATNGTSIVLTSGANVGDIVDIVAYGTFEVADTYTQSDTKANFAYKVSSIEGLASLDGTTPTVIVTDLDRGGTFIWSSTGTANGGTVFAGATGYWNRQYDGAINVKWFGAKGDGVTDDTEVIQNAIDYCILNRKNLHIYEGTYIVTSTLNISDTLYITGDNLYKTIIKNNSLSNIYTFYIYTNTTNAITIFGGGISDIFIECNSLTSGIKIDAIHPYPINRTTYKNILIHNPITGIYATSNTGNIIYMNTFENILIYGNVVSGGIITSGCAYNRWEHIEVSNVGNNAYAYNMTESSPFINNCSSEGVSFFDIPYGQLNNFTIEQIVAAVPKVPVALRINRASAVNNVTLIDVDNAKCSYGIDLGADYISLSNTKIVNHNTTPPSYQLSISGGGAGTIYNFQASGGYKIEQYTSNINNQYRFINSPSITSIYNNNLSANLISSLPSATSDFRGETLALTNASGDKDFIYNCINDGAGTYLWEKNVGTINGSTSVPNATPTTCVTLPNVAGGFWVVSIWIPTGAASVWSSTYLVSTQTTSSVISPIHSGSAPGFSITMSGLSVQINQSVGSTQTVKWSATRLM